MCLFLSPILYCFDYYNFVIWFEIRKCDASGFVLRSQDYFGYLGPFVVPYKLISSLNEEKGERESIT